ncbi:eukaryotic translation initiation factor 3 subunit C [Schistocerca americana]|uniref:Eukaryotic translation initiation factor 3 subunit C n=1 Tax=Schistocerca gregaria TaxID=7010 RepID=A0A8E5NIJ8_SCHGR|nr:eukaryotic translation initiation factor 3 subunit C [Schistocerca americana]XP_047097179.1 eukaryotic translation initiation factor 3 subunit C [Schistocerca piceifrons]XP_049838485.1 eukaryotic translation initiation factor 3 subunit C [Schistocerca gregaria]XP_049941769.1 eukaryotic translation initiation factor 3 subunit C [Schistocerca serialis cubense]QVD39575.1 Eukaryotic translation initiation factor 3 subunit C [Schistocerca gregaria]
MSRFFATGGSDSETESASDDEQIQRPTATQFTFSDEEEDTKRVVRSAKEKRYEELTNIIKQIRNYKKIKDMSSMLSSFEDLQRAHTKAIPVINKEENGQNPRFFIRCLVEMEDFINEMWEDREGRKNMSKNNSKSLTSLRQKLRKYNKEFEDDISKFRENPDQDDDEEEDVKEDEGDSEEDEKPSATFKKAGSEGSTFDSSKFLKKSGDEDEGSDSSTDWGSSTESESESSDDDDKYNVNLRERFLKKTTDKEEEEKKERKDKKERKEKERTRRKEEEEDAEGEWETVRGGVAIPSEKPKMFAKDAEIDTNLVLKKLNEIIAARGKKRTDRREQIELLHELHSIAQVHNLGHAVYVKIELAIVSAIFDYNPKVSDAMKPEYWAKLLDSIELSIATLLSSQDIIIGEGVLEENEQYDKPPYRVRGCILTVVERLDEEFIKLLKECDPHSNEYVERLKDEKRVSNIIDKVQEYLERQAVPSELCRVYLRKIEHLYYKFDPDVLKQREGELPPDAVTSVQVMEKLCKFVYAKDSTDRLRTRAILSHIYHHALHDNWFQARDLILMSHLQETIHHSDPPTQILYNRTMAHLGLCAFRHANIKDAHNCLVDLMMTGKVKELLAQGLLPQRQHERSKEQEKIEKQRQMPFHMHINLELLECVYLVSAMLIEIPYMAAHEFDARRRMISKTFYQQLRSSERQSLVGPPESMREHVVAASKAMRNGNWLACRNFIINEKMNAKVWDLFYQADKVRTMLTKLIKEEALRTYLFTYSNVYDSISMCTLAEMFELEHPLVHSVISKMIINEELMASLDDPTQTVVMHRSEPSRLQSLALQLADKVSNFIDSNERILELKQGNFYNRGGNQGGFRDRQNFGRQGQDWGRQRRERGDNRAY